LRGPRGAGIRRLTGNRKLKATYTKRERLIRHTGQSGHGSGDSFFRALTCLFSGALAAVSRNALQKKEQIRRPEQTYQLPRLGLKVLS